jgi:pantetheine-phosphate adenylyltransferase
MGLGHLRLDARQGVLDAIFPGTFDPVTLGHLDILRRALTIFDRIVVAVAVQREKRVLFPVEDRVAMIREAAAELAGVEVRSFEGMLVDFARSSGIRTVIRGLRVISDFEYEFQMALMNRRLDSDIETVFLMPSERFIYLNATVVKEIARVGGPIEEFVPPRVASRLRDRFAPGTTGVPA